MRDSLQNISQFAHSDSPPMRKISELTKISLSDYYLNDNGYYITPRLKNQIVYRPSFMNDSVCEMLIDSIRYKVETISNIVLSGYCPAPINFKIKLNHYGYKSTEITVPFNQFFNLLAEEGSMPYWGTCKYDGTIVEGVYVWVNSYGGFAHVMNLRMPVSAITIPSEAEVKMNCYVRLDNLKTLFEEYQDL